MRSGATGRGVQALLCAVLAVVPAGTITAQAAGPTLDEVSAAVDDYFADDGRADEARAALRGWGDVAIPHLRSIAGEPSGLPDVMPMNPFSALGDHRLTCALHEIGTEAAVVLLMEIADGKTGVEADNGLSQLQLLASHKLKDRLGGDAHFKALVLRSTLDKGPLSGLKRSRAARTIAELGWVDAAEVVEAMVHDPDLGVAEAAAGALFKLTGRTVEVARPALQFPRELGAPSPLSKPLDVPRASRLRARFGFWRDGRPGLLTARDDFLSLHGPDGLLVERWEAPGPLAAFASFERPDGEGRWIVGLSTERYGDEASAFQSLDREGAVRWRFEPRQASDAVVAPLYDQEGVIGVALGLGGDDGIVALDDDGQPLWSHWSPVLYELRSHRLLPGRLLVCAGDLRLVDSGGKALTLNKHAASPTPRGLWLYSQHALLFPGRDGQAAIIASGTTVGSHAALVRLDENLAEVWRATVPAQIEGLAMLEPEHGPRLFVAACRTGELYVFDADGSVFEPIRLADEMQPDDRMAVYAMDAGPFEDGSWGVALALLERTVLLRLE